MNPAHDSTVDHINLSVQNAGEGPSGQGRGGLPLPLFFPNHAGAATSHTGPVTQNYWPNPGTSHNHVSSSPLWPAHQRLPPPAMPDSSALQHPFLTSNTHPSGLPLTFQPTFNPSQPTFNPSQSTFNPSQSTFNPSQPTLNPSPSSGGSFLPLDDFVVLGTRPQITLNNSPPRVELTPPGEPSLQELISTSTAVRSLYHAHMWLHAKQEQSVKEIMEGSQRLGRIIDENSKLRSELLEAKIYDTPRFQGPGGTSSSLLAPDDSRSGAYASELSVGSRPGSLGSGGLQKRSGGTQRPDHMPESVLWNLQDCGKDTLGACPSASNPSRPSMRHAIRDEDGAPIPEADYMAIRKSTSLLMHELMNLKTNDPQARFKKKNTRSYFKQFHPREWKKAIRELEEQHEILTLCAHSWKAERMLSNSLASAVDPHSARADSGSTSTRGTAPSSTLVHSGSGAPSTSHSKRPITSPTASSKKSKKPRENEQTPRKPKGNRRGKRRAKEHGQTSSSSSVHRDSSGEASALSHKDPIVSDVRSAADGVQGMSIEDGDKTVRMETSPKIRRLDLTAMLSAPITAPEHQQGSVPAASLPPSTDISFIHVDASAEGLLVAFNTNYSSIKLAPQLIKTMDRDRHLHDGTPCAEILAFIDRINTASPDTGSYDEDDLNTGWGHYQFTAGGTTLSTVLTSWEQIGNVPTALSLLAAAIKTVRVAEFQCSIHQLPATNLVSLSYLDQVVDKLWQAWNKAGNLPGPSDSENANAGAASSSAAPNSVADYIKGWNKEQLRSWISSKGQRYQSKHRKDELIDIILNGPANLLPIVPTDKVNQGTKKRAGRGKQTAG